LSLVSIMAIGVASLAAVALLGAHLRERYYSHHQPDPLVVDEFAFNPFKVEGGFGIVVARNADSLRVHTSYGIDPKVAAVALRDAADLLDRPQGLRH
jgi:hypothetical protein